MILIELIKYLFLVGIFLFGLSLRANEVPIEDNLTIFTRLSQEIIGNVIHRTNLDSTNKIILKNTDPVDKNGWFIENSFIDFLKKSGFKSIAIYRGFSQSDTVFSSLKPTRIIEFKIKDLSVTYTKKDKNKILERKLVIDLWLNIYKSSDGISYWTDTIRKEFTDTIKRVEIQALQNENITFTQASLPPMTGFMKVIEPIVIIGLSGTIIYLFYSFRSK